MSVSMFFVSPETAEEKAFNLPACTEAVFRQVILPAAEQAAAQFVQLFETGYEFSSQDAPALFDELLRVANQLETASSEVSIFAVSRIRKLRMEIDRIFVNNPRSVLYIG